MFFILCIATGYITQVALDLSSNWIGFGIGMMLWIGGHTLRSSVKSDEAAKAERRQLNEPVWEAGLRAEAASARYRNRGY